MFTLFMAIAQTQSVRLDGHKISTKLQVPELARRFRGVGEPPRGEVDRGGRHSARLEFESVTTSGLLTRWST